MFPSQLYVVSHNSAACQQRMPHAFDQYAGLPIDDLREAIVRIFKGVSCQSAKCLVLSPYGGLSVQCCRVNRKPAPKYYRYV
jgi:hypothetical protein